MSSDTADTEEFDFRPSHQNRPPKPTSSGIQIDVAGLTHPGKVRPNNEDHFLVVRFGRFFESLQGNLPPEEVPAHFVDQGYGMAVADGMGGHAAGEQASRLAITTLANLVISSPNWILRADDPALAEEIMQRLSERFEQVRDALSDEAAFDPELRDFGTTMTLAASLGRNLFIFNIGDSRAYLLHQGKLLQLTHDHTVVGAMEEAGVLTPDEAATHRMRHVLTRYLGTSKGAKPDVQKLTLHDGDRLLLCSDGLNEMLNNDAIASILSEGAASETICARLIDEALKAGGKDNVTVIVAQYCIKDS